MRNINFNLFWHYFFEGYGDRNTYYYKFQNSKLMKYFYTTILLLLISTSYSQEQHSTINQYQKFDIFSNQNFSRETGIVAVDKKVIDELFYQAPAKLNIPFKNLDQRSLNFKLEKYNLLAENLMVELSSGEKIKPEKTLFYRGKINDDNNSFVTLTLTKQGFNILYSDDKGNFEITKSKENTYRYQRISDLKEKQIECTNDEDERHEEKITTNRVSNADCIELYVECDYKSFQDNGSSVPNTQLWINTIFNNVATLYNNANAPTIIGQIYIWNTPPDPYISATTAYQMRALFVNRLVTQGLSGKIGYLLSTRNLGGGISYGIGGYCNPINKYPGPVALSTNIALSVASYPTYSYSVQNVAHELGHVMGLRHSHACVWNGNNSQVDDCGNVIANNLGQTPEGENCFNEVSPILPGANGTIMSRCDQLSGQSISFSTGFGPVIGEQLFQRFATASCITGTNCGTIPPVNDECLDAIPLALNATCTVKTYDNDYGTESAIMPIYPCITPQLYTTDVWFKAVIPSSGNLTIETKQVASGFTDMLLQAFSGSCSSPTSIACDDDSGDDLHARIILTGRTPGEVINIRAAPKDNRFALDYGEFGICAFDTSVPCHPDKATLVNIYNAMGGPSWTNKTGWIDNATNCNICSWYGVVCDDFGRVSSLNLGFNNVTGTIPSAITNLTQLTKLNLYSNNLSGALPTMLHNLPLLNYIDLADNNFTGTIPTSFGNILNLRTLFLDDNNLTGTLLSSLANTDLETLWLNQNNFSGCIPNSFDVFCDRDANVRLDANPLLPGSGNWTNYCASGYGGDFDNDGYCGGSVDCDDNNNQSYPGATELCDGKDNDCDNNIDENVADVVNNWLGGSGNWSTATNWSTGIVPKTCHDVVIPASAITINISNGLEAQASSVTIGNNAILLVQFNGALNLQDKGELINSGTINIYGNINIDNPSDSLGVSLTNNKNINVFSTGSIIMNDCGNTCIRNNSLGNIVNNGTITLHTNAVNGLYGINNIGTITNNGTITVENIYGREIRIALGSVFDCNSDSSLEVR